MSNVAKTGRMLVVCFDGTTGEYSPMNTNVIKLFSLLKKDNPSEQLCYYQPGIGTYFDPGVVSPLLLWVAKILDDAFAWYLDAHVLGGYRFLMENYQPGDRISIFGFSRGSYIARALAGALYKIGLLSKNNVEQVPFGYKLYKREDRTGIDLAAGFKRTFSYNVTVDFVGVWDTVSSVGVIMSRSLPFTTSNKAIKTFRHALSLDEHRAKFQSEPYHRPSPGAAAEGLPLISSLVWRLQKIFTKNEDKDDVGDDREGTDVLEVWFSGCHEDIGGGTKPNTTANSLSNITLRWMIREIVKSQCGILFDDRALATASIPISAFHDLSLENVTQQDAVDALEPVYDDLTVLPLWWILEFIPYVYTWQDASGFWHRELRINFGRGRRIWEAKPYFHISVKERMESGLGYNPRARWLQGTQEYVY